MSMSADTVVSSDFCNVGPGHCPTIYITVYVHATRHWLYEGASWNADPWVYSWISLSVTLSLLDASHKANKTEAIKSIVWLTMSIVGVGLARGDGGLTREFPPARIGRPVVVYSGNIMLIGTRSCNMPLSMFFKLILNKYLTDHVRWKAP